MLAMFHVKPLNKSYNINTRCYKIFNHKNVT